MRFDRRIDDGHRCRLVVLACTFMLLRPADHSVAAEPPGVRRWDDYHIIMWIGDSAYRRPDKIPLFFRRLREMGVDTGMVYSDADPRPLLENKMPYYVENIVNNGLCLKRHSPVSNWNKLINTWATSRDKNLLIRPYGLDDPEWRTWAKSQMQSVVRKNRANAPLAYDIRDELSTTNGTNPFDYDFSPTTLAQFRLWLQTQYADVGALNQEWDTQFASWADVVPFTTDAIKQRMAGGGGPQDTTDWHTLERVRFDATAARLVPTHWNFSPWADFRTYMDISLANVVDDLRRTAHEIDAQTPVGIEGIQMPHAFGGFDLWRLSQVVDWVEPYDVGNAREIFASFMTEQPLLSTVNEDDTRHAIRKLWHGLLQGDHGCVVWWSEDCIDWRTDDLALTPKAKALAPALREMAGPLARVVLRAQRTYDPIAVHYSQPSIQVSWLIDSAPSGRNWVRQFTSEDEKHNRMAHVRNSWVKAFEDLGYTPRFVSKAQIEGGALHTSDWMLLVMPRSVALSDKEIEEIRAFREMKQGAVLSDTDAVFDEHGKLRPSNPFNTATAHLLPIEGYASERLRAAMPADRRGLAEHTRMIPRQVVLDSAPASRTQIHRFRLGDATLVAFERNAEYHMSDDIIAAGGNANLERPIDLHARFATPAHVYDLRQGRYLGLTDTIQFTLDPWRPSLYALLPNKIAPEAVLDFLLQQPRAG